MEYTPTEEMMEKKDSNGEEREYDNIVELMNGVNDEELNSLDTQLDELNKALDDLEQKNYDLQQQLFTLLKANKEVREHFLKLQEEGSGESTSS